ncbi:unnamed protein product, partial [Oppiella nova]
HLARKLNYWSVLGIPSPKPIPIFGNFLQFFTTPQPIQEINWLSRYGKLYGYYLLNNPVLTIADPVLIKQILVKDFHVFTDWRLKPMSGRHPISQKFLSDTSGDDWRRIRTIVSPTFTTGKIRKTYATIAHCLRDYAQHLDNTCAVNNAQLDVLTSMGTYAMDLIARVTLDIDIDAYNAYNSQRVSPFVTMANKVVESGLVKNLSRLILPKWILWGTGDQSARDFFVNTVREVMAKRRQTDDERHDFMKLLMDAELPTDRADSADTTNCKYDDQEADELELDVHTNVSPTGPLNKKLTENEVLAQAVMFLVAGYHSTASNLTFLTYELALNPSAQQRLYLELMDATDPDTGDIPYD